MFSRIDDPKSSEYDKFVGLIKNFPADANAAAQVKGLDATIAFVENAAAVPKIAAEVASSVVAKCFNSTKTGVKVRAGVLMPLSRSLPFAYLHLMLGNPCFLPCTTAYHYAITLFIREPHHVVL